MGVAEKEARNGVVVMPRGPIELVGRLDQSDRWPLRDWANRKAIGVSRLGIHFFNACLPFSLNKSMLKVIIPDPKLAFRAGPQVENNANFPRYGKLLSLAHSRQKYSPDPDH